MKAVFYHWRFMARDYTRLLLDDKWYFCRHCRRPVEHVMTLTPKGDPDHRVLTCLDCGYGDPGSLPLHSRHGSNQEQHGSDF